MAATTAAASAPAERAQYDIAVSDITYLRHPTGDLQMRLFQPKGAGPFPIMIDLHGGAWCTGDRGNDTKLNEALARSGVVVAALDFRMPPVAGYPASLQDANYAIRWLKARAASLNARADKVGAIGISSGGHQAMLLGLRPRDARYAALPLDGAGSLDARLQAVVLCWPVVDPLGRYRYGKALQASGGTYPEQIDRVLPSHDAYWGNEEAMAEGAPANALEAGAAVELPPVLVVQGSADKMHPRDQLERFVTAYGKRGGTVEVSLYDDEVEGFLLRAFAHAENVTAGTERVIAFVHQHLG
ncbi:MAG: alpha/beta hydrolase [Hyphomicrobiaceae bacterium]